MAHVEILRGISGSGKSTYARTQTDALIVSRDLIRPMFGVVGKTVLSPEKERLVTRIELDLIREALYRGQDVIVDNTNLNERFATRYADLAHTMGATFSEKLFGVDVNVAVGRTDVPDSVVYRQAAQFAKMKPVVSRLPEPIRPIVMGEYRPEALIMDVDGTLALLEEGKVLSATAGALDQDILKQFQLMTTKPFIYVNHTDFERGFIKAEIVSYDDLIEYGSVADAKAAGKVRMEGKDYVMQDGDVVEFRFNV